MSLLYVRPAAILCIAFLLLLPGKRDFTPVKVPLLLLGGLAALMLFQLIPLPPDMWLRLPGHQSFAEAADAAGIAQPWRPISLTPDLTLNSLVSLLIPCAVLVGMASISSRQAYSLLPILIGAALASAVLGIFQLTGGPGSPARLYDVTNAASSVGFLANRNHQALLLALTFPMLSLWAYLPAEDKDYQRTKQWMAAGFAVFLLPMILVTGSRAGLILALAAIILAFLLRKRVGRSDPRLSTAGGPQLTRIAFLLGGLTIVALTVLLSRAESIERLLTRGIEDDLRISNLSIMFRIAGDFIPLGTGFGSFDPVFRAYEPDSDLQPVYFNHAHNDFLELLITGGVPAGILLLLFIAWWGRRTLAAWRARKDFSHKHAFCILGSLTILLFLMSSLVDYPLRTPLMSALFAIACGWLGLVDKRSIRAGLSEIS